MSDPFHIILRKTCLKYTSHTSLTIRPYLAGTLTTCIPISFAATSENATNSIPGPCASSTVRENLNPLTFNDPVYAKQFIRFLDAPVNLWQKLAHQHTIFTRNIDIATQISHLLITGKLRFYELPNTTANTAPLQTQPVQGEGYTTYQFAPTTHLLINDTQPVKEFAQFDTLVRFIDELDIEEKTLQEMNKQLGLYDPLNNHYEASVKHLAEAIYAGKIIVFANDNKIQRQPAELDTYTPTQKPRTLGPEIPAAPIVAAPVEDRKKIDTEQAQALIQASELGTAFCAECEEAKQAEAEASQSPQSQPMAASPIEDRKGIQPHSLDDAAKLESTPCTDVPDKKPLVGQLEPGNPRSTSLPRNGDRLVLDQRNLPTCGPNSCAMVLDSLGRSFDLNKLIVDSKVISQGAYMGDMVKALRNQGLEDTRINNKLSIDALAEATLKGHPAIVATRLDRGGHAIVVDGITTRQGQRVVAIRDPALGRQYFVPLVEFTERFSGQTILTNPKKIKENR